MFMQLSISIALLIMQLLLPVSSYITMKVHHWLHFHAAAVNNHGAQLIGLQVCITIK